MKRISLILLFAPIAANAAATCPTGYIAVDMPDVEIAASCDTGYVSAGTIDDCSTGAGVCAVTVTCKPGQFVQDGECKVCGLDIVHDRYCPDGINTEYCPPAYDGRYAWTWCRSEWNDNGGDGQYGCTKITDCVDTTIPYSGAKHGAGTYHCYWNEATEKYDRSCNPYMNKCDAGYYTEKNQANDCVPVGIGYYSPAESKDRTACPAGYTTRTETATSASDCVSLCTAGATQLHVGPHTFNLYPDEACDRPAIHIGLPGGTCCAHLVKGEGTDAMHVRYNDTVYHTVN